MTDTAIFEITLMIHLKHSLFKVFLAEKLLYEKMTNGEDSIPPSDKHKFCASQLYEIDKCTLIPMDGTDLSQTRI